MIDYSNEIFNVISENLHLLYPEITVIGEFVRIPSQFPTVTVDEIWNTPTHLDNCEKNRYAKVTYRVQVFSNRHPGKRSEARGIYNAVDEIMQRLGFNAVTYSTVPEIYNSEIYAINATYDAVIDHTGMIYRN